MKLYSVQIPSYPGDIAGSFERLEQALMRAAQAHADLVLVSNNMFAGPHQRNFVRIPEYRDALMRALEKLVSEAYPPCLMKLPVCESQGFDALSCNFFLLSARGVTPIKKSIQILDEIFYIRESFEFEDEISQEHAHLLVLADERFCYEKEPMLQELSAAKALLSHNTFASISYLNSVGAYDEYIYAGESFVLSASGKLVHKHLDFSGQELLLDFEKLKPHGAGEVCKAEEAEKAEGAGGAANKSKSFHLLFEALAHSIKSYVRSNKLPGVLIGLSGGLDSALVATIATYALGPDKVLAFTLPGPYSSDQSLQDAYKLAKNLGIQLEEKAINSALKTFSQELSYEEESLAEQNLQARLRSVYLMFFSNQSAYIVLNTGNKSEAAMGYSTLYGDTIGAFSPLKDVYKSDVFRLARIAGDFFGGINPIPQTVIEKAPSAELAHKQDDESSLGASYEVIDAILHCYHKHTSLEVEELKRVGQELQIDIEKVQAIVNRLLANSFKRKQEPLGPLVSSEALDTKLSLPISHRFRYEVHKECEL
ncbi:MAG: NAD(+) synthase [Coriobacteriia bacterium]|nr:NAD(+) synthase [Coriobacteriia bacterium]